MATMVSRVILTIGSMFFLILLLVSYFSKKANNSLSSTAYKLLQAVTFLMGFTEILSCIVFEYAANPVLAYVFLRINWSTGLLYFLSIFYYFYICIYKIETLEINDLFEKYKELGIASVIWAILFIIYMFVPFKPMTVDNYSFISGPGAYYVLMVGVVTIIYVLIKMFIIKNIDSRVKYTFISICCIMLVLELIQFLIPWVSFIGVVITASIFFIYFNIENPDLKYIEEISHLENVIERSSRAKSDFLSNMSHEIRSPMNAIIGFSSTIIEESNFDKARVLNDIGHIKSSSKNLLDIINNILDISKIETGSDTLELREYSLDTHIIDWTGVVKTRLENKNIKFLLEMDREIPRLLYGDSTKVFQVVLNLLTNAVKYTEVGKIKMTITKDIINNKTIKLKFRVSDTGFGIKKEDYDKVFQKFSRLESAKTNEIEGTGLGLVLTKKYAQLMGGDIWFESEYGAGSTFYFEVPQRVLDPTPLGNISEKAEAFASGVRLDCSQYTALIVDDDELNLEVTKKLLSAYKFNIETASSGTDCIYKYKSGNKYDIVFLDHIMPGLDGIEVAHVLKSLKGYNIPVVVALTANAITGVREMYLKEGFDEYLSKPIDLNELDKIINMYFGKQ